MKVSGVKTQVENIEVNIDLKRTLRQLEDSCMSAIYSGEGEYINKDNVWESWYDTGHGSGLTTIYEKATQEQIDLQDAFKFIHTFINIHNID